MLLKDILLRDPSKNPLANNGQARIQNEAADEKMLAQLRGELVQLRLQGSVWRRHVTNPRLISAWPVPGKPKSRMGERFLWQRQITPSKDALPSLAGHRFPGRRNGAKPGPGPTTGYAQCSS